MLGSGFSEGKTECRAAFNTRLQCCDLPPRNNAIFICIMVVKGNLHQKKTATDDVKAHVDPLGSTPSCSGLHNFHALEAALYKPHEVNVLTEDPTARTNYPLFRV